MDFEISDRIKTILEMINELKRRYENESCGIEISEIGGYKLTVKPKFVHKVSKLTRHAELSRGLLRALSIIAYNEPVKQSDLVKVLGNRVYEYVKKLISEIEDSLKGKDIIKKFEKWIEEKESPLLDCPWPVARCHVQSRRRGQDADHADGQAGSRRRKRGQQRKRSLGRQPGGR